MKRQQLWFYIIAAFLFIVPFFWLKPGTIDLGGDSSRLYFYDPINYLKSYPLYTIVPNGFNAEINPSYLLPFTLFLTVLKKVLVSPYLLTTLFNSLKLVGAFLSVAGIVITLLRVFSDKDTNQKNIYLASLVAAIFYTLSPALTEFGWWTRALYTHHLFFLNPLMFLLLLKYVVTKSFRYVLGFLFISFVFSPNFFISPYFLSFYPLAVVFLGIFTVFILNSRPAIKEIVLAGGLYLLLHVSHIMPDIIDLFKSNSQVHDLVFSNENTTRGGLNYFLSVEGATKFTHNILGLAQQSVKAFSAYTLWVFAPLLVTLGLLFSARTVREQKMKKTFLLLMIFWFFTLFFATAKITNIGLEFYKFLFNVPGFSMFRNYVGQFLHVYIFFYALVVGFSSFYIFSAVRNYKRLIITIGIVGICIIGAFPFLRGDAIRIPLNPGAKDIVKIGVAFDKAYENVLEQIRNDPLDSKYLLFPMDDSGAQVLRGIEGGYVGPPTIAYLTGKSVFSGLGGLEAFQKIFLNMVLDKDYEGINNLLLLLNIRYIFHNTDPFIYGENFFGYPYGYVRKVMPLTQDIYTAFVNNLSVVQKVTFGNTYRLYNLNEDIYTPHIYIAKKTYYVDGKDPQALLLPFSLSTKDKRIAVFPMTILSDNPDGKKDNILLLAKRESSLFQLYSQRKDVLLAADSVPPNIYALLHPLLVLQEKTADETANRMLRLDFDTRVYSAQADTKSLKNISYEMFLAKILRYRNAVYSLAQDIQKQKYSLYSPLLNKARLGNIVAKDAVRYKKAIFENGKTTQAEKDTLKSRVDETFLSLQRDIYGSSSFTDKLSYMLDIPVTGVYSIYSNQQPAIDETSLDTKTSVQEGEWFKLGDSIIGEPKKVSIRLTNTVPTQLVKEMTGVDLANIQEITYGANIKAEGLLLEYVRNTLSDLVNWTPNTRYLLTFEYQIKENTLIGWKTYKMIIETADDASSALLLFLNNPQISSDQVIQFFQGSDIEVRNLAVVELKHPQIVFVKKEEQKTIDTPRIVFEKINPTRYIISVKGATLPYVLIFQDAFNKRWKLFLQDAKGEDQKNILQEYYNGEIAEASYKNLFFNLSVFENWNKKAVAESKHYTANGYANGWFIEPSDTKGDTDYTFVLEMTSQRQMDSLFLVSCITATLIAFWFLFSLKKYFRKRKG